jgi:hypothetical protein
MPIELLSATTDAISIQYITQNTVDGAFYVIQDRLLLDFFSSFR